MGRYEHVPAGKTGDWAFSISHTAAPEGGYSGAADVSFQGKHQCKLVLSSPCLSRQEGDEVLRKRCVDWIEQREGLLGHLGRSAEPEEA